MTDQMFTGSDLLWMLAGVCIPIGLLWLVRTVARAAAQLVHEREMEFRRVMVIGEMDVPEWINERLADPSDLDDMLLDSFRTAILESGVVGDEDIDESERDARTAELIQCVWEIGLAYGEGVRRLDRLNDD